MADSIRTLYAWGIGAAFGLGALVWWFTPAPQKIPTALSSAVPQRQKVILSAIAPPTGFPAGTTVMASFPDVNVTVQGQLLPPGPDGKMQVEFELPSAAPPGRVEMWTDCPAGVTSRWSPAPVGQNLGPPQTLPATGKARDLATYRYPNPVAKAPQMNHDLKLPKGTVLPPGVKPMTAEQLKTMAQRYHAQP